MRHVKICEGACHLDVGFAGANAGLRVPVIQEVKQDGAGQCGCVQIHNCVANDGLRAGYALCQTKKKVQKYVVRT